MSLGISAIQLQDLGGAYNSNRYAIPDETAAVGMVDKVRARSNPTTSTNFETGRGPVPEELLGSVVAYFNPRRIILFGSRARGEEETDSDLDLLVILDDDARPELLSWRAGYEARKGYHRATDIVPCRESVFRHRARIVGSLAHTADTEGFVVYERD